MSWRKANLAEIASIDWGNTNLTKSSYVENGSYIAVSAAGTDGRINHFEHNENTVVISAIGANCGVVFFPGEKFTAIKNTITVTPNSSQVSGKYLYWFFKTNVFRRRGAGQPFLSKADTELVEIPLPPLATQKRIAEILDAADALRRKDQELLKKYDELAQAIFIDMFGDPVKNEKGWDEDLIKNIASKEKHSIKAGPFGSSLKKEFYKKSGYKIYGQEQVIADDFSIGDYYIDEDKFQQLKSCAIKEDDILISLVGTYGKISVVPKNIEKGIINPRLMKISLNRDLFKPQFFKYLLQTKQMYDRISTYSRGGTMDIVNVGIISDVLVIIPPLELQDSFISALDLIKKQKNKIEGFNLSDNLFNTLIKKAFNGELVA